MRFDGRDSGLGIRDSEKRQHAALMTSASPGSESRTSNPDFSMTRSEFLRLMLLGSAGLALAPRSSALFASPNPESRIPNPGSSYDFWFTRLMYESGDWDVDQRMPSNLLDALIQYTTLRVDTRERILPLADARMLEQPYCYLA